MGNAASCYPGVQNLHLAARALGLGATLTLWHLFLEDDFKRALGIPRLVTLFALIPMGYPRGHFGPVRRPPVAEVVHWDCWLGRSDGTPAARLRSVRELDAGTPLWYDSDEAPVREGVMRKF